MASTDLEEARIRLYQKSDRTKLVLGIGGALFAVTLIIAILNGIDSISTTGRTELPIRRAITWFTIAFMCLIGPYGFYAYSKQRLVKQIERRLPDFLRDVAEAGRFGMILAEAIVVSSSGRYGKLTPEIKKMAAQISWGVPATEALRLFSQRVKTPMTERVVSIIVKSSDAGGDVADVLTMVSHATKETQLTEEERRISMSTYVAVIYISFLVFIVTIWIMNVTFLPKMVEAGSSLTGGTVGGSSSIESPLAKDIVGVVNTIQLAFITALLVHAVGDGVLAGVLDNGKIATGLRHSFIMLLICVLTFMAM
jgi:flagellar protein FlaJ